MSQELAVKAMELNAKASAFGMDTNLLALLVKEHGEEVLNVINDALSAGLNQATILETLNIGGKVLLEVFASLKAKRNAVGVTQIINGQPVDPNQTLPAQNDQLVQMLLVLAEKFLPAVLASLGPTALQSVVNYFLQMLLKSNTKVGELAQEAPAPEEVKEHEESGQHESEQVHSRFYEGKEDNSEHVA